MSRPRERSTAGPVSYTWVARSRSESTPQFTALALNKPSSSSSSSSSYTWVALSRSESTSQFTALALNKPSFSSSSSSSSNLWPVDLLHGPRSRTRKRKGACTERVPLCERSFLRLSSTLL